MEFDGYPGIGFREEIDSEEAGKGFAETLGKSYEGKMEEEEERVCGAKEE